MRKRNTNLLQRAVPLRRQLPLVRSGHLPELLEPLSQLVPKLPERQDIRGGLRLVERLLLVRQLQLNGPLFWRLIWRR